MKLATFFVLGLYTLQRHDAMRVVQTNPDNRSTSAKELEKSMQQEQPVEPHVSVDIFRYRHVVTDGSAFGLGGPEDGARQDAEREIKGISAIARAKEYQNSVKQAAQNVLDKKHQREEGYPDR